MANCLGISLIEILISFLMLSIMLLGLDAMQLQILQKATSVYYYSVANQQLHNMAERLFAQETHPLEMWNKQNSQVLPQGIGYLMKHHSDVLIRIAWGKQKNQPCNQPKLGKNGCMQMLIKSYGDLHAYV